MSTLGRQRGTAMEAIVCTPSSIPLPPRVRSPVRLEYLGMLYEFCSRLHLSAEKLPLRSGKPLRPFWDHCDRFVRTCCVLNLVARVFELDLHRSRRLLEYQADQEFICDEAETYFASLQGQTCPVLRTEHTQAYGHYLIELGLLAKQSDEMMSISEQIDGRHFVPILRQSERTQDALCTYIVRLSSETESRALSTFYSQSCGEHARKSHR